MKRLLVAFTVAVLMTNALCVERASATFRGRDGLILFDNGAVDGTLAGRTCLTGSLFLATPIDRGRRVLASRAGDGKFSPDGKKVVFSSCDGITSSIEMVHVNGTHRHVVIQGSLPHSAWSPSFSPSGKQIVFVRSRANGSSDLWIANADGTHRKRLTHGGSETHPIWSPNGRYILFSSNGWLWKIRPDGTHERRLRAGRQATIAPSGRRIAYLRDRLVIIGNPNTEDSKFLFPEELCVMDPSGVGVQKSVVVWNSLQREMDDPVFSPTGRAILYAKGPLFFGADRNLWWTRPNGSGNHLVRLTPHTSELRPDWQPR